MFDHVDHYSIQSTEDPSPEATLIAHGQAVMMTVGGRMVDALGRLAGDHGAALGDALRATIMSGEVAPAFWPIGDAIRILARADPAQDRQVERVLGALDGLKAAIDQQEEA